MNTNQNNPENIKIAVDNEIDNYKGFAEEFRKAGNQNADQAALDKLDYIHPDDTDLSEKALVMFENKALDNSVRLQALGKIADRLFNDTGGVQRVIQVMLDKTEAIDIRNGALNTLLSISFSSPAIKAANSEFMAGLKALSDDENAGLKSIALETLASYNDDFALAKIKAGIDSPETAVFSEAKAVQLLGLNRTGEYNQVIQDKLQTSQDADVQIEAIHALSADPNSEELIKDKLEDKTALKDVRLASLKALQALSPERFVTAAKSLLADDSDYHDIRVAAINSIALQPQYATVFNDEVFTDKVKSLSSQLPFKAASDNYLTNRDTFLMI